MSTERSNAAGVPTASITTSAPRPCVCSSTAVWALRAETSTGIAPMRSAIESLEGSRSSASTDAALGRAACAQKKPTGPAPTTATMSPSRISASPAA